MSAGVGIWNGMRTNTVRAHVDRPIPAGVAPLVIPGNDDPFAALIQQVFLAAAGNQRKRVLFASADAGTEVHALCETLARSLSEITGDTVAVIHSGQGPAGLGKKPARALDPADPPNVAGAQIADRVWRVPAAFVSELRLKQDDVPRLPFDYTLFASNINDGAIPLFGRACEGAILIIAANRTRREAGIRAKEFLEQCHIPVLGAVLGGREYPIPESIYRRL